MAQSLTTTTLNMFTVPYLAMCILNTIVAA
jgi:hypothetical protein